MKCVCALLLLVLVVTAGCCDCGWGRCGWGGCCSGMSPAPGAVAPYAAQRQSLGAADQQLAQSQVERTGNATVQAERQVQYYDGNQSKTFLR